jgi:ribonuclease HI
MIRVFTDGACKSNGKAAARASYAAWFPENKEWSFAVRLGDELHTNQRAELKAISEGIRVAHEKCGSPAEFGLHIFTDSVYSKNCLTTWLSGWVKNKWKTAEGNDVKHRDLIEAASELLPTFREYTITYVKAHTGKTDELSVNNDIVDKMATKILMDAEEVKTVSRTANVFPDLPLSMMGPPLEEAKITEWCKTHLDLLDQSALKAALFTAFQKTVHKNGYGIELQRINKTRVARLVAATSLVKEGITIVKQE